MQKQPPEVFLKFSQNFRKTRVVKSLFYKVAVLKAGNFPKNETATQVFSCELCEIFKNTDFEEHMRTTASVNT